MGSKSRAKAARPSASECTVCGGASLGTSFSLDIARTEPSGGSRMGAQSGTGPDSSPAACLFQRDPARVQTHPRRPQCLRGLRKSGETTIQRTAGCPCAVMPEIPTLPAVRREPPGPRSHRWGDLGSRASVTPSPTRLTSRAVMNIASPGGSTVHQASNANSRNKSGASSAPFSYCIVML